jgi:hypothetical protein
MGHIKAILPNENGNKAVRGWFISETEQTRSHSAGNT